MIKQDAEYVAVDDGHLAHVPRNLSLRDAAALPLVALTTVQAFAAIPSGALAKDVATTTEATKATTKATGTMLQTMLRPFDGDALRGKKVLIHAGAGGVGTFAVQYAKRVLGAETVITTASPKREALLKGLGADVVLDYRVGHPDGGGGGEEQEEEEGKKNGGAEGGGRRPWFLHPSVHGSSAGRSDAGGSGGSGGPVDVVLDTMSFVYEGVSLDVLRSSGRSGGYPSGTGAAGGGAYLNVLSSDWRLGPGGVEVGA